MNKIPVGKTIAYAYSFAFGGLGTIIGLVWLPLVVVTVLNFLPGLAGNGADAANLSPVARLSEGVGTLAVFLLSALLYAVICNVVTRQALGLRQGSATIHFALGMPEFRMFGTVVTLIALELAFLTVYALLLRLLPAAANLASLLVEFAIVLVVGLASLYALIRLSFLLIPVTVVEEQMSLPRSWNLMNGNFWRAFAISLAVALPVLAVYVVATAALMSKDADAINHLAGQLLSPPASATEASQKLLLMRLDDIIDKYQPERIGLGLILAPFALGLNLGASAFAYRSVVQTIPAPKNV